MPEWLTSSSDNGTPQLSLEELFTRLALSFLFGCAVAAVYRYTRGPKAVAPTFPPTLVLLSILIAMVTQVIGDNVARAFSLVGALSIVRFRTVVQDTQDTAFVIFAVVVGMAVGANHLRVAIVGLIIVAAAALLVRPRRVVTNWEDSECYLAIRIGLGHKPETLLAPVFEKHALYQEIQSVSTARQGSAMDVNFKMRLRNGTAPADVVSEINRLEGVQSVDLRREQPTD